MGVLDNIARIGVAGKGSPIGAFLIGRQQRLENQRRDDLLALQQQQATSLSELRRAQTDAIRAPQPEKLDADVVEFMQVTGTQRKDPEFGKKFVDYKQSLKGKPPSTTVNIKQPPLETAADKEFGKTVGERAANRVSQGQQAVTSNADLSRIELALDRGANTGFGEETILNLKSLGSTLFGVEFSEADQESEVLRKIGNELALKLRNPDSGLGLTGSTSNKDLDFLKASVPNLQKTEGGNLRIIEYTKRINQMKADTVAEQSRIIRDNGGRVPGDLDSQVLDFVNNYQIFTEEERAELEEISTERTSLVGRPFERSEDDDAILDEILSR